MSELSELYTPSATLDDGFTQLTYPWRDDTNYPDYYQSFTKYPERGTIDLSIFSFRRSKRSHALGSAITATFARNEAGSHSPDSTHLFTEVRYNNFSKNNETPYQLNAQTLFTLLYPGQGVIEYPNTWDLFYHHQYSPNALYMYTLSGIQNYFYSIVKYNGLVIIPYFTGYYAYTNQRIIGARYDQLDLNQEICITRLTYGIMYDGSRTPNIGFIHYAGKIPVPYGTGTPDGGIRDCRIGTDEDAVIETMIGNVLYMGQAMDGMYMTPMPNDYGNPPGQLNFFDTTQCQATTIVASGRRAWGISVEDCIMVLNELGYYYYLGEPTNINWQEMGTHCVDPLMYVPVIDDNTHEVTTTVLHGTEIADYAYTHPDNILNFDIGALDYNGKSFQEFRESYTPRESTTEETDEIDLNIPVIATTGGNTLWMMDEAHVKQFFTWMWDPEGSSFDHIVNGLRLMGNNPMDSIVSMRLYPLDLTRYLTYLQRTICFGRSDSGQSNFYVTSSNVIIIDLGSFYFNDSGMFNDFRDYEPYSRYSLYVPFCGIIPLNAIECINTTISIKMIIDLVTGACTAVIYTNDVPYKYLDGMIGIEIPVTGRNMVEYAKTVLGAALGGAGAGLAMGNKASGALASTHSNRASQAMAIDAMGAQAGLAGTAMGDIAFAETSATMNTPSIALGLSTAVAGAAIAGTVAALTNAPAVESKGSNTPAMGLAKPLYPYFIVQRSDCWMPENYAKLYGRPLNEGGKIGDFSGYSEFGNINLDGISGATSAEKTLISDLLTSGVYL